MFNFFLKNRCIERFKGFSLTELSVSIAIIAMIAGSALSVAITSDYATKKRETDAKLDRIEEALAGFFSINKRLPCPADGELPTTDADFGLEGVRGEACPNTNFNDGANVFAGVVPIRTLQMPDDFMFDGWDRRIMYVVDYRFANNDTTVTPATDCDGDPADICFMDAASGSIIVDDASGNPRTSNAVYLLLSNGENGHGAYSKIGSATRIQAHYSTGAPNNYLFSDVADEIENSHFSVSGANTSYDNVFVQKAFIKDEGGEYFDDMVRFREKDQIIIEAGETMYQSICRDAKTIIDNPGASSCTGAASESNCEDFASQINERCLQ